MKLLHDGFVGRLIITWPKPTGPVVAPHGIVLTDAETGERITSAVDADIVIHVDLRQVVTATMTMIADADGQPLASGAKPVLDDDGENVRTAVFRWLVAEMRVAE